MVDFCFWRPHHSDGFSFKTRELNLWFYFNRIQKHQIPISWAQWFWTLPSGGRNLIHEPLTGQSCIIGLSVPSATLWRSRRSIRRLSDRDLTRQRIFCSALFALCARAKNRIQFHTEWNRKSFKMNVQRIQLNLSPIFSESRREKVKQEMSFFYRKKSKNTKYAQLKIDLVWLGTENTTFWGVFTKKNRKVLFMQNKKLILYD